MEIQVENYVIKQSDNASLKFDLFKIGTIQNKDSKNYGKETESAVAYGCGMDSVVKRIVSDKLLEDTSRVDLKTFLTKFKGEVDRINNLVQ